MHHTQYGGGVQDSAGAVAVPAASTATISPRNSAESLSAAAGAGDAQQLDSAASPFAAQAASGNLPSAGQQQQPALLPMSDSQASNVSAASSELSFAGGLGATASGAASASSTGSLSQPSPASSGEVPLGRRQQQDKGPGGGNKKQAGPPSALGPQANTLRTVAEELSRATSGSSRSSQRQVSTATFERAHSATARLSSDAFAFDRQVCDWSTWNQQK